MINNCCSQSMELNSNLPILICVTMNCWRLTDGRIVGNLILWQFSLSPNHSRCVQPEAIAIACDARYFQYTVRSGFCKWKRRKRHEESGILCAKLHSVQSRSCARCIRTGNCVFPPKCARRTVYVRTYVRRPCTQNVFYGFLLFFITRKRPVYES